MKARARRSINVVEFNPQSLDAQFATLREKIDGHHSYTREQFDMAAKERAVIRKRVEATNGRVTALEFWKTTINAKTGVIAAIVSGGVVVIGLVITWIKG